MISLNNEIPFQISKYSLSEIYKKGLSELDKLAEESQISDSWSNLMVVEELPQNPDPNCIYLKYNSNDFTYEAYVISNNEWQEIQALEEDDSYYNGFTIDNPQEILMYDREI